MRGDGFHNHLVRSAERLFIAAGFETATEHRMVLPDGRVDYIDLLAWRDRMQIACEVETTPRYVAVNVAKAAALGLPLLVLAPTRAVHRAVLHRLRAAGFDHVEPTPPTVMTGSHEGFSTEKPSVHIFLFSQLHAAFTDCFQPPEAANTTPENKCGRGNQKTNPRWKLPSPEVTNFRDGFTENTS